MEPKPAIAVVFQHIGPYHHARLNAAAEKLLATGLEWSAREYYPWGAAASLARYHKVSLFPEAGDCFPGNAQLRRAFYATLQRARPDVVAVNGWNDFGSLAAANCCVCHGIPMVVMSESARGDEPRTWWKEMIKRRIVDLYSAALVGGQRHVEYLVELGMPRDRIFTGYDVVDNAYFARRTLEIRKSHLRQGYGGQAAFEIRKKYGLPENYFLASARFIEKKNLPRLIRAYAEYRQRSEVIRLRQGYGGQKGQTSAVSGENAPWDLVLLGDGPLRKTLNSQLSTLNLHPHVHLPGFKPYDELPVYYALASAFVHASTTEQWGLVVNEALASGLPVIVSSRCGCVPELVQDNGFTFDPVDEHELASRLSTMASLSHDERQRLGDASYRIAMNFAPERFGAGLEQAAHLALRDPSKASLLGRVLIRLLSQMRAPQPP
ncbi:MAG: glycosyl transferase family 1 [Verrucomicrobia bacterium]|nr:MAG: glycosyl transferase family 1 [Verrucomicrobiota bacterium]PYJ35798.1 MAG: glycosyl transferase family 1 [Verrucomicrobiota bacterium]